MSYLSIRLFCYFITFVSFFVGLSKVWASEPYADLVEQLTESISEEWVDKTIAVFPFENQSTAGSTRIGNIIIGELTPFFIKKKFKIVERSALNKLIKESQLQQSGLIKQEKAVQIGGGLGAHGVVVGSLRRYRSDGIRINARLVDVETHQVISAGSIILDSDLLEDYEETKVKKEGGILINLMGGVQFFRQTWTRGFEDTVNVPRSPPFTGFSSDTYHVTEVLNSISYRPLFNISAKITFLFSEDNDYINGLQLLLIDLGFFYANLTSTEQTITRNTTRSVIHNFSNTARNSDTSGNTEISGGDFNASIFTFRPGVNVKFDFWKNYSYVYGGISFDLGLLSINSQRFPLNQAIVTGGVNLQGGLRIGLGHRFGILTELIYTPVQQSSYEDPAEGIGQGGLAGASGISTNGLVISIGLSFFI